MLTPLQEQVASIIASLVEAENFALAGGAALIARGDVQRQTRDLDFFGLTPDAVDRLVPAVERALQEAGLVVHHVQESSGFARLIVESRDDSTELDLGADARLFPAEPARPAPMLSGMELAVDKVLAIFGRAEARDFVNSPRSRLTKASVDSSSWPRRRHRGFTPEMFAEMAGRFSRLRRDEFGLDSAQYEQLERTVLEWQERARHQ